MSQHFKKHSDMGTWDIYWLNLQLFCPPQNKNFTLEINQLTFRWISDHPSVRDWNKYRSAMTSLVLNSMLLKENQVLAFTEKHLSHADYSADFFRLFIKLMSMQGALIVERQGSWKDHNVSLYRLSDKFRSQISKIKARPKTKCN